MSQQDVITGEAPGRYAKALFDLADESKSLNTLEKDVKSLKDIIAKSDVLREMMNNPVHAIDDKAAALTAVATKAGLSKLLVQFVGTAAKNQRAAEIPAMLSAFENIVARHKGSQIAKVASAKKLTAAQLNKIKSELKSATGQDVDVETSIDPDLLGGFIVRLGSSLYDSSLKTKLDDLKLALKEA